MQRLEQQLSEKLPPNPISNTDQIILPTFLLMYLNTADSNGRVDNRPLRSVCPEVLLSHAWMLQWCRVDAPTRVCVFPLLKGMKPISYV